MFAELPVDGDLTAVREVITVLGSMAQFGKLCNPALSQALAAEID
jgi:hypothetical protein